GNLEAREQSQLVALSRLRERVRVRARCHSPARYIPGMDLGLTHKIAVVHGASRGIGRAIALALAGEGARVVLCARNAADLAAAVAEAPARRRRALPALGAQ